MTAVSEPETAPRLDDGDWARLVRTHQASVWRYVRYLGAEANEADDLVQETFLALARAEFTEQTESQTGGYLRTVARNRLLMLRRKQNREASLVDLEMAELVWVENVGAHAGGPYLDALGECVDELDGRARRAIDLKYQDDQSREAIATQLDMKPEGVKTLLRRTRDLLRDCVERRLKGRG